MINIFKLTLVSHFKVNLLLSFVVMQFAVFAQDSTAVNTSKKFTVKQESVISELLYNYKDYNRKREFADGYRIQITYTDVRDEVYKSKGTMYKEFPDQTSYVEYEQPYYKLRLGDYKTRLEATHILQQIIPLYPGSFIVRDKIKVR